MSSTRSGIVKCFSTQKGYGFITKDDEADIFVHYSSINGEGFRTLEQGQKVQFIEDCTPEGKPEAKQVEAVKH